MKLLSKQDIEEEFKFSFRKYNYLITFHPETRDPENTLDHFRVLLKVLENQEDSLNIFTMPNADAGNQAIVKELEEFVKKHQDNSKLFKSLGQYRYLSVMRQVDCVIGNSSSGIIEAPSLKVGTINIGKRQEGRARARSVVNCNPTEAAISRALQRIKSEPFQNRLKTMKNPYGNGGAAERVLRKLKSIDLEELRFKKFIDLKCY